MHGHGDDGDGDGPGGQGNGDEPYEPSRGVGADTRIDFTFVNSPNVTIATFTG